MITFIYECLLTKYKFVFIYAGSKSFCVQREDKGNLCT